MYLMKIKRGSTDFNKKISWNFLREHPAIKHKKA